MSQNNRLILQQTCWYEQNLHAKQTFASSKKKKKNVPTHAITMEFWSICESETSSKLVAMGSKRQKAALKNYLQVNISEGVRLTVLQRHFECNRNRLIKEARIFIAVRRCWWNIDKYSPFSDLLSESRVGVKQLNWGPRMEAGRLRIPSENWTCDKFESGSRMTIRQAINNLVEQGYLYRSVELEICPTSEKWNKNCKEWRDSQKTWFCVDEPKVSQFLVFRLVPKLLRQ